MTYDFDLFVIGGGSGGVRAARLLANAGGTVALAEEDRYGGTCVIRGCVPKKLMVYASGYKETFAQARGYGWSVGDGEFSWPIFQAKLHQELNRLENIYKNLLDNAGVTRFDQRAKVIAPHEVELADGTRYTAKTILIATGGKPSYPDIKGAHLAITSNDIFHLKTLPERMLIIGGGYIACEFACILNALGVEITQWYRGDQILRGFDGQARTIIADQMRAKGINLITNTNIKGMDLNPKNSAPNPSGQSQTPSAHTAPAIDVTSTSGQRCTFDQVMFATGRTPNTDALALADTRDIIGPKGEIVVDAYSQTSLTSIYAIGDVTNRINLTPVAIREAGAFISTIQGHPMSADHDLVPSAVFTQPEFGTIGLSEEAAQKQEPIDVYATCFEPMHTSFAGTSDIVLLKLVVSRKTNKVLGCHIIAPQAGEMIQLAGIAIKMGATKQDFDRVCAVHPTMSEELVTMKTPVRTP